MNDKIETQDWVDDGCTYTEQGYYLIAEDGKNYWVR